MRVMITGGTGFIGSNLARGLVSEGHEAIAYDLRPTWARISDIRDRMQIVEGDICDSVKLVDTIQRYKIDRIMHLAAYLPEAVIRENPTIAIRINEEGTNNIFDAARTMDVERVVYASTDAVNPLGPKEDVPCKPTTLYGHLKLLNEAMGVHFHDRFGLDTIALRFGMNYGPGGRLFANELERKYASAVIHDVIEKVAMGESVIIPFHESTSFHCVYIADNVRAMTLALKAGATKHKVFNTCGEEAYTLGDMARVLKEIRPQADIQFGPAPMPSALRTAEALSMDCSSTYDELGYAPEYSLESGLKAYVDKCAASLS